jgi:hypothetical protein
MACPKDDERPRTMLAGRRPEKLHFIASRDDSLSCRRWRKRDGYRFAAWAKIDSVDMQNPSLDQAPLPLQGDALAAVFVTAFRALPESTQQAIREQLLQDEISDAMACALASEATLAKYWDTLEEDAAWAYLSEATS